jgi:MFS family permease
MDPAQLLTVDTVSRASGQLRSAIAHVRGTPALVIPLAMMAVIGTLSYNFQVLLPLIARFDWDGGAGIYAALTVAMGVGSVTGALASSARNRVTPQLLVVAAIAFGVVELAVAAAPVLWLQLAALAVLGAVSVTFAASVNSLLQLTVAPALRGRVMALYSVVFLGSTPIGAPLVGWMAEVAGPRSGLLLGALAALVTGLVARVAFARADVPVSTVATACEAEGRRHSAPARATASA